MADIRSWLEAFRLRTLPLAISSILVGSSIAYHNGRHSITITVLAMLTAVLLQILSNLANDLGDFQHGTDNDERLGPTRSVQSGAISPDAMKRGIVVCGALALCFGLLLIYFSFGLSWNSIIFLAIGIVAIYAAIKYTYGINPYGYAGLGDVFVFLFFGLVGVAGTYYLHAGALDDQAVLFGIVFGLLSTAVLNLNNMRDIKNDAFQGKNTMAVRLGSSKIKIYHFLIVFLALVLTVYNFWFRYKIQVVGNTTNALTALYISFIPASVILLVLVSSLRKDGKELDPFLKKQALSTFFLAVVIAYIFYR